MPLLEIHGLTKAHDGVPTLNGIDLTLEAGEILCLLGPSGCGKTTLLRLIAGLEQPDSGNIFFNGSDLGRLPSHKRNFGMMFQEFALFPHRNVSENIAFGLQMKKLPEKEIQRICRDMLALVGLETFANRKVGELSGGERQRVALARSLAPHPGLLMLDEPMGALDRALRERLMLDIRRILKRVGVTTIFVTHDQAEALAVADQIAIIHNGRVEQMDRPEGIYKKPATEAAARFLGFTNILEGRLTDSGILTGKGFAGVSLAAPLPPGLDPKAGCTFIVRPDGARLVTDSEPAGHSEIQLDGIVTDRLFQGRYYRIGVDTGAGLLFFDLPNTPEPPGTGERMSLALQPESIVLLNG